LSMDWGQVCQFPGQEREATRRFARRDFNLSLWYVVC
jgi:hypothetical protein